MTERRKIKGRRVLNMQMSINENVTSLRVSPTNSPRVPFREKRGTRCKLRYVAYIMQRERLGYPFFVAKSWPIERGRMEEDTGGFAIDERKLRTLWKGICVARVRGLSSR